MIEELVKVFQVFVNKMFECIEVVKKYPALRRANKRLKLLAEIEKERANTERMLESLCNSCKREIEEILKGNIASVRPTE